MGKPMGDETGLLQRRKRVMRTTKTGLPQRIKRGYYSVGNGASERNREGSRNGVFGFGFGFVWPGTAGLSGPPSLCSMLAGPETLRCRDAPQRRRRKQRMQRQCRADAERMQSGCSGIRLVGFLDEAPADTEQIQSGYRVDSERIQSRCRADAERT